MCLALQVLEPGAGPDTRPVHGQFVTISYEGKLQDGTVVDSQDSQKITLGDGDVVQALDLSVSLMELNEMAVVVTDPRFAYGDKGCEWVLGPIQIRIRCWPLGSLMLVNVWHKLPCATVPIPISRNKNIPANANLTYHVKVLHVEGAPNFTTMSIDDRLKLA